jgi:hypothetical protein
MPNGNIGALQRANYPERTFEEFLDSVAHLGLKPQQARRLFEDQKREVVYRSDYYQVAVVKDIPHGFAGVTVWWLSIKRVDREPIMDWRDLQAIKTAICGAEAEAIQLFPAESRVVDTANQYHLYAFMRGDGRKLPRVPIGWTTPRMVTDEPGGSAKQRPMEPAQTVQEEG